MIDLSIGGRVFEGIEAIVFDKDGTLEDSRGYWAEIGVRRVELIEARVPGIARRLFKAFGITPTLTLDPCGLMALGSRVENEIAAAAYIAATGRDWPAARAIARRAFLDADRGVEKISRPFPDCVTVLRTCHARGLKLAIVSADTGASVEGFVRAHGLETYIGVALGSDGAESKPDPALLLRACDALGVRAGRVLIVGDGQTDIEMGVGAGVAGIIAIAANDFERENLRGADLFIRRLEEIITSIYP